MVETYKTGIPLGKTIAHRAGSTINIDTRLASSVPKVPEVIGPAKLDYDGYIRSVGRKWEDLIRESVPDDPILRTTVHGRTTAAFAIRTYFWFLDIEEGLIPPDRAEAIVLASELHDSGKTPEIRKILKKATLTEEEKVKVKEHTVNGAVRILDLKEKLMRWIDDPEMENVLDLTHSAVLYHHERIDGNGYFGLEREDIPLGAQIVSIAETFAAKIHGKQIEGKRTLDGKGRKRYQKGKSPRSFSKALEEIRAEQGRWEPKVVDALTYAARNMTAQERQMVHAGKI